ncbi:N-6 DNA methylase [Chitinophaga sp. Ak27]|uniref:N-6 DNA methylase n=1 Tax=Chitinophaga sp. Ak27 TaxID=2726116 RepID=UPI001B7D1856|nr:N-6 DNA methylase [Chitinophaga sp. Ak27]
MAIEIEIKGNKIKAPLKGDNVWLVLKPEEIVRQKYICRLANTYGFSLEQMEQEVLVSNTKRGTGGARADIIVYKNTDDKKKRKNAVIIVECKADNITIQVDDYFQGANYAAMCGADFFVTTNEKETKIFKVVKGEIPKRLDEVVNIPDAKIINDEKKISELLKQTKAFTRDEFSKLLFKCHNIIRNNDKLSPEAAFDEISKILFIKIRYERANSENQIFSKEAFKADKASYEKYKPKDGKDFYQFLFEQTKEDFKDDDLFEPNEIIRIRENSFEAIVEELEIYNLSTTSDDVKGIAFEQFLGKTFRGELGQFFTPRTIVDFMVEVLDPQEGEAICDPCCGSGGFLIKAFEYVRAKIENEIHSAKEKIKKDYYNADYEKLTEKKRESIDETVNELFYKLNAELDINNSKSRIRELSYDCIFGTDANPRMSRTAKMNMIMHGDGHGGVHHNDGLLNVNGIFENRFDVILTNPPFGSRIEKSLKITEADKYTDIERIRKYQKRYGKAYDEALKQVNDNIGKSLLELYETGSMSTLTEVLFIERCLNLLKPGGRMGIVLPEGVLNNTNLQKTREFVESKAKILFITSIPQDVFIASGATVKPSLLFFKKFTEEEAKQYNTIAAKAEKEALKKYQAEVNAIQDKIELKGNQALDADAKKQLKAELRLLEEKIISETKALIKARFSYSIPIAEVQKAGISSTGSKIENELEPLAEEFKIYRNQNHLWSNKFKKVKYEVLEDDKIYRIPIADDNSIVSEPEIFYVKN